MENDLYFQQYLGISFDALIAPIDPAQPAGQSLRNSSIYHAIAKARRQDDASLPMGQWEHDLKRADWEKVSAIATDALARHSKDLQLAGWLLEAQINKTGFTGIAACINLMHALCDRYWDTLHPAIENGDAEYRANIISWIDKKLLSALRLIPIATASHDRQYSWADWEQAQRNEQLRNMNATANTAALEGTTIDDMMACIASTPTNAYDSLHRTLTEALRAIETFASTINRRFGNNAPSLSTFTGLLEQIDLLICTELHKRGVQSNIQPNNPANAPVPRPETNAPAILRDRAEAYARLAETADFLMRLEPHSPVPYIVKRAAEWGRLNTVELYQELFLKLGGQLNIFEMLGLPANANTPPHHP